MSPSDEVLEVDITAYTAPTAAISLQGGPDHKNDEDDPMDMSLAPGSVQPSFNTPQEDLPSPLSVPRGAVEMFRMSAINKELKVGVEPMITKSAPCEVEDSNLIAELQGKCLMHDLDSCYGAIQLGETYQELMGMYSVTAVLLQSFILVVMRTEAMLWPFFQFATGNTVLLLPWDPGLPLSGMDILLSTLVGGLALRLSSSSVVTFLQGKSIHELSSCSFVVELIKQRMIALEELQPGPSSERPLLVTTVYYHPPPSYVRSQEGNMCKDMLQALLLVDFVLRSMQLKLLAGKYRWPPPTPNSSTACRSSGDMLFSTTMELEWNPALIVSTFALGAQRAQLQPTLFRWSYLVCHDTHSLIASTRVDMRLDLLLARRTTWTLWTWYYLHNLHYCPGSNIFVIPDWQLLILSLEALLLVNYCSGSADFQCSITVQQSTSLTKFFAILSGEAEVQRHYSCTRVLTDNVRREWIYHHILRILMEACYPCLVPDRGYNGQRLDSTAENTTMILQLRHTLRGYTHNSEVPSESTEAVCKSEIWFYPPGYILFLCYALVQWKPRTSGVYCLEFSSRIKTRKLGDLELGTYSISIHYLEVHICGCCCTGHESLYNGENHQWTIAWYPGKDSLSHNLMVQNITISYEWKLQGVAVWCMFCPRFRPPETCFLLGYLQHNNNKDMSSRNYPLPCVDHIEGALLGGYIMVGCLRSARKHELTQGHAADGVAAPFAVNETLLLPWDPGDYSSSAWRQSNTGRVDNACYCHGIDTSQVPWDPITSSAWGKPDFKEGGLSTTYLYNWADGR